MTTKRYRAAANPAYAHAMAELRRSNAATPHETARSKQRRGVGKGGRRAWRATLDQ